MAQPLHGEVPFRLAFRRTAKVIVGREVARPLKSGVVSCKLHTAIFGTRVCPFGSFPATKRLCLLCLSHGPRNEFLPIGVVVCCRMRGKS